MNKQRYFDVSFRYSRASWGVLWCLGVSWGNKTDPIRSPYDGGLKKDLVLTSEPVKDPTGILQVIPWSSISRLADWRRFSNTS